MTISGCSMPRLASASWKRGSATIAFPASSNSSMWIAGCTPGTSRQSTRRRSSSETIASWVIPSAFVRTTRNASRGGVPAASASLAGSRSSTDTNRTRSPRSRASRTTATAATISSPVSGSSGFVVMDGAANGIRGY